jgi:hypothetical protein
VNALVPPGGDLVTLPGGTKVNVPGGTVIGPNGTMTLPADEKGTATTSDDVKIDIPGGTVIEADGTITLPSDKEGSLKLPGAEANLPGGTVIEPNGTIKLPPDKGNTVTTMNGIELKLPGGTAILPDGTVTLPPDKSVVATTSDGKVEADISGGILIQQDGTLRLSENVIITAADGTTIELDAGVVIEEEERNGDKFLQVYVFGDEALITYPDGKTTTVSGGKTIKMNSDGSVSTSGKSGGGCNIGIALFAIIAVALCRKKF